MSGTLSFVVPTCCENYDRAAQYHLFVKMKGPSLLNCDILSEAQLASFHTSLEGKFKLGIRK